VHVEGFVEKILIVPNRPQKASGCFCNFQQWHPRRLSCGFLSNSCITIHD